jgi:glycosyltransferase involved in cell wall biosynthesis
MKVIQVHNRYRYFGGEDAATDALRRLLIDRGLDVRSLTRNSSDIGDGRLAKLAAGFKSIYSRRARVEMSQMLKKERPELVHIHNLYPLLTPSILQACREASIPVVMTLHNFRFTCPIGVHFADGVICERCVGGREYACVLRNCRGNRVESALYSVRTLAARKFGLYTNFVDAFIAPCFFLKEKLVEAGFARDRLFVLPNFVSVPNEVARPSDGAHVAFIGRFSAEKGVKYLLSAAREVPTVPLKLAGDFSTMPAIQNSLPENTELLGELKRTEIFRFYQSARFVVVPSTCYEVCPMVVLEAMSHGLPVIASRIGGLPELVEDGETGLLFEPRDAGDLAKKIQALWSQPELCDRLGAAARRRVIEHYSDDPFFAGLQSIYLDLVSRGRRSQQTA